MFDDLKAAILAVLEDASPDFVSGTEWRDPYYDKEISLVKTKLLQVLQAEYNIYFVEPTDKQIDIL